MHMRPSRREFMEAAAAVTAFAIAPRHALGGLKHTAPSDKLNIACVGCKHEYAALSDIPRVAGHPSSARY